MSLPRFASTRGLRFAALSALFVGLTVAACSDDSVTATATMGAGAAAGASNQGGGGNGGEGAGGTSDGGGGSLFPGCDSNIICGDGECCDVGDECVIGTCLEACASQVRCGADLSDCCQSGWVCINEGCVQPGAPCLDWADCPEDQFCEPTLGQCLPQPDDICEYLPETGPLNPTLEWTWESTTIMPAHVQVINMPVVIDLEKDGVPDVVAVTSDNYSGSGIGYLRALDGATGAEKWTAATDVYQDAYRIAPRGTPAAADIDGDGFVEIVTPKAGGGLIAFEHDGSYKWTSTNVGGVTPWTNNLSSATVAIADLEGDGTPEIVVGGVVFENTGELRFNNGVYAGSNAGTYGAVSIVADLDGVGDQEIVSGRYAWHSDGTLFWDNGLVDGYPAIGDLDLDGLPELVVIAAGEIRVQDPTTGTVLAALAMPAAGAGGPPTIANFDMDPEPEIASANGGAYAVFGYASMPTPTLSLQWSVATQDLTSNRTGSSVFDFQGDGIAEVVYADECYFRIYNGVDGTVLFEDPNASATIHEFPVVADVDGDNNTEVVVAANNLFHTANTINCPYPGNTTRAGIFVYGDSDDNWVRTRKLWNQHAYHLTNINSDGSVPAPEAPSWIAPAGLNNYRQSNQGTGVFNAPDLQVSLNALSGSCPDAIGLNATVQNLGSLGVAAGVPVSFYAGSDSNAPFIGTVLTTTALLPGQFEVVTIDHMVSGNPTNLAFFVVVDGNQMGDGVASECLEDNNEASVSGVTCPGIN